MSKPEAITIETIVQKPVAAAWKTWTEPEHIMQWCQASDDWHAPYAENDVRTHGVFKTTMAARDGSVSFDFEGVYTEVIPHEVIAYALADGRTVKITFTDNGTSTKIVETFDPETVNPVELQREGWQSILDSYTRHTEKQSDL